MQPETPVLSAPAACENDDGDDANVDLEFDIELDGVLTDEMVGP